MIKTNQTLVIEGQFNDGPAFLPPEVPASAIAAVASDRSALIDALAEFGFQLVQEHGKMWDTEFHNAVRAAEDKTMEKVADALRRDGR